ncbi:MAG: VWA domain-containing protein [Anaerolineae bacterium]
MSRAPIAPLASRRPLSAARRAATAVALAAAAATITLAALPPPPTLAQTGDRVPSSGCRPIVTETVRVGAHRICDANAVTVTVGLTCPQAVPVHVVFMVAKHLLMEDHLSEVKNAARDAVNSLNFITGTQAGVISLSVQAYAEQDLTDDKGSVMGAINRITLDGLNPFVQYYDWLGRGSQMLDEGRRAEAIPPVDVMVLYSTGCPTGFPDYCNRQKGSANKAIGNGITVIGVCNPRARPFGIPFALPATHCNDIRDMSSRGYYFDLSQASRVGPAIQGLLDKAGKPFAKKLSVVDSLAPGWKVLPRTAIPTPSRVTAGTLQRWDLADVQPGAHLTFTYGITATSPGRLPLRLPAAAVDLEDNLGRKWGPVPLPTRDVDVGACVRETATPTATATPTDTPTPTATDTPAATSTSTATPTATATATSVPGRAYLPLVMKRVCKAGERPKEVLLAIDTSQSMLDVSGGQRKIDAAKLAAKRFVALLDLSRDWVGIAAFNSVVESTHWANGVGSQVFLDRAIDGLTTAPGTRIDVAMQAVVDSFHLDSAAWSQSIILLTDGLSDPGTDIAAALAAAADARARGIRIYTIGLGDTIDEPLLTALADPGGFHRAADASALQGIYEGLAAELPCPGGAVLGR